MPEKILREGKSRGTSKGRKNSSSKPFQGTEPTRTSNGETLGPPSLRKKKRYIAGARS